MRILRLITTYPEFRDYYKDIVTFRRKPKELISIYSEALAILDHNTELYMINELQNSVKELKDSITEKDNTIAEKDATIAALQKQIEELSSKIPD